MKEKFLKIRMDKTWDRSVCYGFQKNKDARAKMIDEAFQRESLERFKVTCNGKLYLVDGMEYALTMATQKILEITGRDGKRIRLFKPKMVRMASPRVMLVPEAGKCYQLGVLGILEIRFTRIMNIWEDDIPEPSPDAVYKVIQVGPKYMLVAPLEDLECTFTIHTNTLYKEVACPALS